MPKKKKKSFWGWLKAALIYAFKSIFTKDNILNFLKTKAVKFLIKKVLGSGAIGGIKGIIVMYIATELYEELAEPIVKAGLNEVGYQYDVHEGKANVVKISEARENNNENDYNTSVDDTFSH